MDELEANLEKKNFNRIIFVFPPHILGYVRDEMSTTLEKLVTAEIHNDLTRVPSQQIFEEMRSVLLPPEPLKAQVGIR